MNSTEGEKSMSTSMQTMNSTNCMSSFAYECAKAFSACSFSSEKNISLVDIRIAVSAFFVLVLALVCLLAPVISHIVVIIIASVIILITKTTEYGKLISSVSLQIS